MNDSNEICVQLSQEKLPVDVELFEWVPHEKEKQTCGCRCEWQSSDCVVDEWASAAGWWTALLQMQPIVQAPRTAFQSLFWTPNCLPMQVYVFSKDFLLFALPFFLQAHSTNHGSEYLPTKAYPFHFYSSIVWPNPCRLKWWTLFCRTWCESYFLRCDFSSAGIRWECPSPFCRGCRHKPCRRAECPRTKQSPPLHCIFGVRSTLAGNTREFL